VVSKAEISNHHSDLNVNTNYNLNLKLNPELKDDRSIEECHNNRNNSNYLNLKTKSNNAIHL